MRRWGLNIGSINFTFRLLPSKSACSEKHKRYSYICMYTRYPESYCAAFKNIPSKGVGAEIRKPCQVEESHSFPISPLEWHREMGCKHIPWALLADTATLYLYPTGWWHIAEVSCTLLPGSVCFMELEHLARGGKKTVEENRARSCIRICVICMFYKLSIWWV